MSTAVIIGGSKGLGESLNRLTPTGIKSTVLSRTSTPKLDLTEIGKDAGHDESLIGHLANTRYFIFTAGVGYQGNLSDQSVQSIEQVIDTIITGPLKFWRLLLPQLHAPVHVVTVASTTSFRVRSNETTYGSAKAGQAQMARDLHQELKRLIPGSKSTLIHPGGMNTPFWDGTNADVTKFLDADQVADIIWRELISQDEEWKELAIIRENDAPRIIYGTPTIEFPK